MKRKLFKSMLTAGAVAMICACGDDANSSGASDQQPLSGLSSETSNPQNQQNPGLSSAITDPQNPTSSASEPVAANPCDKLVLTSAAWLLNVDTEWLIYPDGRVTDFTGNNVGSYADGVIHNFAGEPVMQGVDLTVLPICQPNATVDPHTGEVTVVSSSSVGGTEPTDPTSSVEGTEPVEASSSSAEPVKTTGNPEEDIKKYPVPTLKNILGNGTSGWNTRYWDACKPHCSQTSTDGAEGKPKINTQEEYEASHYTARVCNIHDIEIPTFTYSKGLERYWIGIQNTPNACDEAQPATGGGFTCTDMAPVAVNDTLAYAFVAGSASTTSCGKCFHLQYDGSFKDADGGNAAKATHKALKGKHIIVMASNIGHDVKAGQFDLMVPGGGPGIFNALNLMVDRSDIVWGAQYGGFLTYCQSNDKCGYDGSLDCYQSCIKDMCDAAFADSKYPNLLRGCHWFADWYMAADNPTYQWEEVDCPQYLLDKYSTTISTSIETKILFQSDWSAYKGGDFITTDACNSTPNAQGEYCDPEQLAADKAKTY
ncbi:Glycosyl hydrolase family 45 [Fibrobacter sp. UWT2]|uniref:glycosyl hydrolase family 5 n=1 Tax=Fibrobacter sp. UWT2 TaxID=1896224 RepID=UPI00091D3DA1|nr:glycosyl hydrolase family 5 [Fibrobacter sp. UWT2]SHL69892.1 Glycosyl hydrolase family 45 [Fibrobacter sp. UWT2]